MTLRHRRTHALLESLDGADAWSRRLSIFQLDDVKLYTIIMAKLQIPIKAASNISKNRNKPAPFHEPISCTSAKTILGELRTLSDVHRTGSAE